MRQAIAWTNVDPIHWRIYVALCAEDELKETINIPFDSFTAFELKSEVKNQSSSSSIYWIALGPMPPQAYTHSENLTKTFRYTYT